ncbi:MAG: nuclear transport factor 2 family protein [Polyangia bacterium]
MRVLAVMTIVGAVGCGSFFAKRDVLRGNQAIYDGIRARDVAGLRALVSDDFRYDAPDGKPRNRDEWLAGIAATPGEILSVTGMRLTTEERGDRLTVCGVQRAIVRLEGKEIIDDAPYCNDWQRRDGRWVVVESYVPTL